MSGFENYQQDADEIELEIERKAVALGIDWQDENAVRALAKEALDFSTARPEDKEIDAGHTDYQRLAKIELFGLAALMLRTMEESAALGFESHGGSAWKSFARALWAEKKLLKSE